MDEDKNNDDLIQDFLKTPEADRANTSMTISEVLKLKETQKVLKLFILGFISIAISMNIPIPQSAMDFFTNLTNKPKFSNATKIKAIVSNDHPFVSRKEYHSRYDFDQSDKVLCNYELTYSVDGKTFIKTLEVYEEADVYYDSINNSCKPKGHSTSIYYDTSNPENIQFIKSFRIHYFKEFYILFIALFLYYPFSKMYNFIISRIYKDEIN